MTSYRDGLANGQSTLGRILMALGREPEAKDAYRSSFAEYERLVQAAPRALDYRTNLGDLMVSLGRSADDVQRTIGRLPGPDLDAGTAWDGSFDMPDLDAIVRSMPTGSPDYPRATPTSPPVDPEDSEPRTLDGPPEDGPPWGKTREQMAAELEFGSRYDVLRLVGRGGLGNVWLVHDHELHRDIVLKDLRSDQPEGRRWFLLEAQITAQLTHPGVVPVYDLGRSQSGRPFYTMKFIEGHSLLEIIQALHAPKGGGPAPDPLGLRRALGHLLPVCRTIAYAHSRGVVHRDIKPSNILIGEYDEVFVSDWGLAKVDGRGHAGPGGEPGVEASDNLATMVGTVVGTPAYMSPEQAMGVRSELDPRTDVYSLGATLFHILTGRPPRLGSRNIMETLRELRDGKVPRAAEVARWVPPELDAICARAMAFALEDRYPRTGDLAEDLRRWLDGESGPRAPWYRRLGRQGIGWRRGPLAP